MTASTWSVQNRQIHRQKADQWGLGSVMGMSGHGQFLLGVTGMSGINGNSCTTGEHTKNH